MGVMRGMRAKTSWNIFLIIILSHIKCALGIQLTAYISENGVHGTITFHQHHESNNSIKIHLALQVAHEYSEWSWSIHEFPVYYTTLKNHCSGERLGPRLANLDDIAGQLSFPDNSSGEAIITNDSLSLVGASGIWGRSLLLESSSGARACATVTISGAADEKIAEARFFSPIAGSVFFRWAGSQKSNSIDTLIQMNLYRVAKSKWSLNEDTKHKWKIFTTDILDSEADKARENCNFLQLVFDPASVPPGSAVGDIDVRLGPVQVSQKLGSSITSVFHDPGLTSLPVSLLDNKRSLYLVIFDSKHQDSFLACAKIREVPPITYKAQINSHGIKGQAIFSQRSPFDPTWMYFNLTSSLNKDAQLSVFKIHELPPVPFIYDKTEKCSLTGQMYNPSNILLEEGSASQDTYAIGDLSGKHNIWRKLLSLGEISHRYWDINLPLQGPHSIGHRSLVFYRGEGMAAQPWLCATLIRYTGADQGTWKVPMTTAAVVFRYPTVGRILLRQPRDLPWADTTILVESLVHGDGTTVNNSVDHRWLVHDLPPGQDFYNWTGRCLSAGSAYNPYKVHYEEDDESSPCGDFLVGACRLGDLSARHGPLVIAGQRENSTKLTRHLFTDVQLPLSGAASVLGRSLVLYDDHGPKARGERLACSQIMPVYRRKAVIKDWFGNGELTPVRGKIEIYQQTEYDITDIEVDIEGLRGASGYHVHVAPIQANLDFPCEETTVYGHWNPHNVSVTSAPLPTKGSIDQYEMGDLSGKFGLMDNLTVLISAFNDTDLPLFGPYSILGRSVVIHKKEKNLRWACSSIERGYAPSEAREIRAIASFHHPLGFAYGYIRMTQLIYNIGSASDTVIEVNLRHPGKHDRNVTRNHNWAIYVNPVGVDASVKILNTRCVAGGYVWNPYYTQLADPRNDELYQKECRPDNPLRCYVGDVSGRLGTIDIGDKRQVFTDINFPLEGPVSAVGRSIVILNKDKGSERFACANIEPDYDIIKYANLRKPPKFVMAQFIEDVREIMGIPEWMLSVDTRKTKLLHNGGCIQFLIHFKGPVANQLEQDFNRLLNTGKLATPTLQVPGFVPNIKRKSTLSYKPCGTRDPTEKKSRNNGCRSSIHHIIILLEMLLCKLLIPFHI